MSSNLPVQTLIQIALEMNLPDLVNFCAQSKHVNDNVCLKDRFWLAKIEKDFPGYPMVRASPSENYVLLYQLVHLAKKTNWKGTIFGLYESLSEERIEQLIREGKKYGMF